MQAFASLLLFAALANAHYHFSNIGVASPEWSTGRVPKNSRDNGPVTSLSSVDLRCNQASGGAKSIFNTTAGGILPVYFNQQPWHQGPYQVYMARVPEGQSVLTWDGAREVWFKIFSKGAYTGGCTYSGGSYCFPDKWDNPMAVKLPDSLPSGDYLVRAEHIGLHIVNSPQFYIGCGQVSVAGGGSGTPGPLVSFPGAYKQGDKGIFNNFNYPKPTVYRPPGPDVWTG
ncbi:glycosyl hydrolase family 61-domain-containing protein [Lasiosphaeris hirsuta]|uniref:lytic cellulose monooxygenase (C4-dehydrogenating) n=1 Tax=Lasiosphaeris hirsuta TaxID=260670 RepID=A0AA40DRM0_9PEZI|nr:glycosyl hydrolase family 61-domain-containing protein [Lasiosphaeris hirsuta]